MSPEELSQLEALEQLATAGPWSVGYIRGQCHVEHVHDGPPPMGGTCRYDYTIVADGLDIVAPPNVTVCMPNDWGPGMQPNNAALTVAARNALPELLAECREAERLREHVRVLREALKPFAEGRAMSKLFYTLCLDDARQALAATAPETKETK